jgi:NAD+ kinase
VLAARLAADGIDVVSEVALSEETERSPDAIVVLGGDGLMIRAANAHPGIPLLGINFGNVGFLALVERRDWERAVADLAAGSFSVQEGPTLQAAAWRSSNLILSGSAINDVVIRSGNRMVDVEVYIDGRYFNTYPGDGMIVSTPHGSTAYCMAAGGPILTSGVRGFAIVPISCHSPIRTPFVVPENAVTELVVANDHEAFLILDGSELGRLQRWDVVRVERGAYPFRLITLESTNFYEAFRTKFNFRIRPDAIPSRESSRDRSASSSTPGSAAPPSPTLGRAPQAASHQNEQKF